MEFENSSASSVSDPPAGFQDDCSSGNGSGDRGAGLTSDQASFRTTFADKPDALEEITLSATESEGWVQPSSISYLASQGGTTVPANAQASGEFVSLPSQSNSSSKVIALQQGQGTGPTVDSLAASEDVADDLGSTFTVINALKREVFATSALLRALRMHGAAQTRGLSVASQQQLAAAVAPLVKSFELLNERLAAAEAAKEPPPTELQEQHIHPFLFVLAQQQLQHKQQQGLNKQQQLLHQSCMRALASAVLRSLDQLLTVGLLRCRSAAGRRCLHALVQSLRNCALQATQRLHSAPTQPSAASATAAAAAVLGSEAYGGTYFAPASPAAEEELLLLQCLDLLSSSLLGPAGHVFSDACVASTIQCCVAVSLLPRASPLLRNAAASRAVAITRHLFAAESLIALSRRQGQLHQGEGTQQQRANPHDHHPERQEEQPQQQHQQHASPPPHFIARLESAMSIRSADATYSPTRHSTMKSYGLECRVRILALVSRLLSHEEPRQTPNNSGSSNSSNNTNNALYTGVGSLGSKANDNLPPFVPVADPGSSHSTPEVSGDTKGGATGKEMRSEEVLHSSDASAPAGTAAAAPASSSQHASASSTGERGSRLGTLSGIDRDFESLLGHHGKDKAANMETRLLCLRLLCVALEAGRESFSLFPKLLQPLHTQILPLVLQQDTRSAPLMLLSLTLRVVGDFIAFLRPYVKDELERCLYQLLRLSTANHGGPSKTLAAEAQEVALDMLRELCSDSSFGFEMMLNYDSDIRRSNVFGVLVTLLLQLAAPRVPSLRGTYRFAECDIEGGQVFLGGSGSPLLHAPLGAGATASEASTVRTPTQQQSPSGSSPSSVSTTTAAESSKSHHHSAFHLRRAPPRSPLKASRSSAEASAAVAAENLAADAAGVTRPAGLSNVNRLALAAVLRLISSLASLCDSVKHSSTLEQQQQEEKQFRIGKAQLDSESAAAYFLRIQEMQPISERRKHKALLSYGAAVFNSNTKEAISQLESIGLLPTPATPKSTALFLKETGGLDLRVVGLYLSSNKPWNAQVLREFVALFSFTGIGLVAALRNFLKTFRLPGESQQIERVMEAFADEFFRQQPLASCPHNREKLAAANADCATTATTAATTTATESPVSAEANPTDRSAAAAEPLELSLWRWVADEGFYCSSRATAAREGTLEKDQQRSSEDLAQQLSRFTPTHPPPGYVLMMHKDTVFVLSYSIIMLNTDQHNCQVRSKMRVEDFVKNNRGINNGSDLPAFFLQNIYISIKHQEIKLKETPLTASSTPPGAQGQKADAAGTEQQQQPIPDIFDVLADGWTPPEGAGLGWAAFASPYNGSKSAGASAVPWDYKVVLKSRTSRTMERNGTRDSTPCIVSTDADMEGLEMEMFRILWNGGSLAVLRGAFEASLDLRQLEEILCGVLSLARAATVLGQVVALNTIVAELCSYFVYSVPAHSQLVLAPIMYLVRRSGAYLREEGWGAVLELLLRLHALDLLPPALMGLDDFEGSGGAALPSLCTLTPPPFVPPASRRDRGGGKKGGGWLGDLTSILFALGDSDDESDGDEASGAQGQMTALSEELNFACDGLYVLRASTDFTLLPSTVAASAAFCSEVDTERDSSEALHLQRISPSQKGSPVLSGAVGPESQLPKGYHELPQREKQAQQQEAAGAGSSVEDEEAAAARAPYLRLKTVLSHGIRIDVAVAEIFRQIEPVSSLSTAVVLLLHIVLGFPPIRQNPGASPDCPLQAHQPQQQQQPSTDGAAPQCRNSSETVARITGGSSSAPASVAPVQPPPGTHHQAPPPLQPPEDLGLPSLPGAELSMLSSYLLDAQRGGLDDGSSRRNSSVSSSNGSSAVSTPVGANMLSTQCHGFSSYSLPPPVWSPLRAGTSPQLMTYRAYTDRLFCLELLGALMLSELTPGSLSLRPSKVYGTALLQNCPWLLCAVYLDTFLRRYSIGTAAGGVPNPLEVVGLVGPVQLMQQQQETVDGADVNKPSWTLAILDACSKDPLAQATVRSVCNVFQSVGARRLVDTPTTLPHWELLFIERLVVTVLRICLRLLSDEDSLLLPVYTATGVPQLDPPNTSGCTAACQVAIHLLQLLTLLHPNIFCMHVQRICQSAIILVSRLNLRACSSPLLIQVLLALYQRLVPLPAFLPTAPLPQHLTQPQPQQQVALRIVASLADWIGDPEALALLVLQHRNHYQMLLQTLMAICIYVPPSPSAQTVCPASGERRTEGEAQDNQQPQPNMSSASSYEANCTSLALLASLIPSIGEALKSKGEAVAACLASAASGVATANGGNSSNWKARLDCQAMWLQTMQVLAIVCSFSARPVKVKALAVLQQMLIHCSRKQPSSGDGSSLVISDQTANAEGATERPGSAASNTVTRASSAAVAAADYWATASEDAYTWRLCLQLVVFPLLSLRFDYPYTPLPPGDAPPPPPHQQQHQANGHSAGDSAYTFTAGHDQEKQPRDPHFGMPWMALPTRRRLTPEVAIGTLGLDEVYQRKAAAASLACRLFLTKMELLLQPFKVKGIYVDFVAQPLQLAEAPKLQQLSGDHPGGIEGLLPPLTQLVQLLVTEAKQAPVIYRDAFLESMKNTLLVVLTCPFAGASPIPADLKTRISPASVLPVIFSPKQQQQQQQQQEQLTSPNGETQGPRGVDEAAQLTAKQEALLGTLSCLTDSQRLVISAVSPFVVSTFPTVIQELLLILPTPQPPPPPPSQDHVASKELGESTAAEGASELPADCSPRGCRERDNGEGAVVTVERREETRSYSTTALPPADGAAFDEAGPAAEKIRRLRKQIVAQDRELWRQQRTRSCSIVQKIVREEWAAGQNEAHRATSVDKAGGSSARRSAGAKGGVAKLRSALSFDASVHGTAQKQSATAKPLRGLAPSTARPDNKAAASKHLPLKKRSLSVFEQKKIEKALQAQQQAILEGTPQRIAGRVYSGPSFRCSPSEVAFKAFEAGGVYSQDVEVTNVSLGFSTFRVLPLPEEVEGIISVAFEAPGRLSAGRSTRITVTFTPKREEDLNTEILLLSPTGPQSLPVICSRKRSVLSFRPHKLSPQALLKSLHALSSPARGACGGVAELSKQKKAEGDSHALNDAEKVRLSRKSQGSEEKEVKDGVVYLSAGDIQLGEVAAVRFRVSNTGSLGTAYRLFPVSPEGLQEPSEVDSLSNQRNGQSSDTTGPLQDFSEELPLECRNPEDPAVPSCTEFSSAEYLGKESNACQPEEDLRSLSASGWLEALQGEAVVLAQRLRISDKQNTVAWARILSSGLGGLLKTKTEQDRQDSPCTATPLHLSPRNTLVKNAAGELDALQTQEITIVHAPTRTGRFVGFFALQFSDPDHEDVVVVVDGQCVLPPVCMDAPLHDLGICVPGRGYRQHFQVTSSSNLTRTLQVASPEVEEGVLWVEPRCSFVQPKGVASLTAHLCLSFSFFDRHPEYVQPLPPAIAKTNLKSVAFKIPIQIRASDQILCAETAITGVLTELHLHLSRTALNFGMSENTIRRTQLIKVHNPSLLIASFGFRSSDRALRVLEPPQFSDLNGGISSQQALKHQDSQPPAPGISCSAPPQEPKSAVISSSESAPKEESTSPKRASGSVDFSGGDWQETHTAPPFLALRQPQETDSKAWDDLHQYLPHLDCGGTGTLLPGETRTFAVVLDPTELRCDAHALQLATGKAVEREGELRMRVLLASEAAYEVKIPWSVTLIESPIAILPAPSLKFPVIPIGQSSSATLELKLLASQLSLGRVDIEGSPKHSSFKEVPLKECTQFTAVLIEVQQPPSNLSALSITPTRVLLYSKKRCASLFISFNPTTEYMQIQEHLPPAVEAQEIEGELERPSLSSASESVKPVAQPGGGALNGDKSPPTPGGSARGKEGAKKAVKSDNGAPIDLKSTAEKRLHKDAKSKQNKPGLKSGGSIGEDGETAPVYPSEDSAESVGNGQNAAAAGFTENCDDAAAASSREKTNGTALRAALLNIAKAGGARWTSLEEDGGGDFFAFDDPRAFHHSRWLIPLKIWRLTPRQVDAFLVGKEIDSPNLPLCNSSQSFIEVSTCATPPLVVASLKRLDFGSVMVGQRVYQQVHITCSPFAPPCSHAFHALPLPLGCRFSLISAAREVSPERPLCLTIAFQPNAPQNFAADLTLQSARTRITISLSGSGIQQTVDVVPFQTAYDMGAVVCPAQGKGAICTSSTSYTVSLKNRTSTPLAFTLVPKQSRYPQLDCAKAGTGVSCFSCELQQGVILGLSSVELVFHFRPQRPEGWLRGDFELALATEGHATRVLSFFGLATANPIYVTVPFLPGRSAGPPLEVSACSSHEGTTGHSSNKCCCDGSVESKTFEEALRGGDTCLACCMERLPRLSAERNLLCSDDMDSPWNRTVTDEGNPAPKAKGQSPSHQQTQMAGSDSGIEKKRFELQQGQQVLHIRFCSPSPDGCFEAPDDCSGRTQCERIIRDGSNQRQPIHSPPPSGRDERQKGETGGIQQEADLIIDNDVTRTIVVAGAWSPGRQGLPPYASVKGEACGNFEITVDPSPHSRLFTFEPSKGTVSPGTQQLIRVGFSRQPPTNAEERIRSVLSHLPTETLKKQQATATARLCYRGSTPGGGAQSQEVAVIRLSALL